MTNQVSLNTNELKDFLTHIITNNRHLQENSKGMVSTEVIGESGIGKASTVLQLADEMGIDGEKKIKDKLAEVWGQ